MRDRDHNEAMVELYRKRPEVALEVINDLLADREQQETLFILRQLTKAYGGVPVVAEAAGLNPTQLYRTLSIEGNPSLKSLTAVLKAMKLRLAVRSVETEPKDPALDPTPTADPVTVDLETSNNALLLG